MTTTRPRAQELSIDFQQVQQSPEFKNLKRTYRNITFPLSFAFFSWYLLYLITAITQPEFMAAEVYGHINVGLVFGVLQFVSTFAITATYVNYANRRIEPQASALREALS